MIIASSNQKQVITLDANDSQKCLFLQYKIFG